MRWVGRSPGYVAALMLRDVFGADEPPALDAPGRAYPLTDFQEAAARRACAVLERWNGVLIADSVGLGKTYIALALIEEEARRGGPVVVTVPASLRPLWRRALRRLRVRYSAAPIQLLSHAQLSRGSYSPSLAGSAGLVVVDEAHRFRNPRTRRYAALLALRANARVALLTATPVNNSMADLHHLLRLFADDHAFVDLGVPSLGEVFEDARGSSPELQRILREVMVRRTRSMVRAPAHMQPAGPAWFPRRAPPRIVRFVDPRVPEFAGDIAKLELAPYAIGDPPNGHADCGYGGVAALIRLGLLKRLESSTAALATSIRRQLSFSRAFLAALDAGRLLRPGRPAGGSFSGDVDPLQLILFDLVAERCPPGLDAARLAEAVQRDTERLRAMLLLLAAGPDPKMQALRDRLGDIAAEKVVVFTEFRDTAEDLWRRLAPEFAVARIDGGGAWLGTRTAGRGVVVERFAPRANGVAEPPVRERVDVLIVTDVLSEGSNLQDARHVISYDLPWNPVRLMQRIGRVDRLGSPHHEVVPHLFLPASGLEQILGLTRRLRAKIGFIAASIGDDDAAHLLARLQHGGTEAAAALDAIDARDDDPMEELRLRWQAQLCGNERLRARSDGGAAGMVPIAWVPGSADGVLALAAVRFRGRSWLVEVHDQGQVRESGHAAARLLTSALESAAQAPLPGARPTIDACRAAAAVRSYFHTLDATARAPHPIRAADPAARIARRLRRAMVTTGAWARPALVARADRALQKLDRPLPPHTAERARRLAAEIADDETPERLLDLVDNVFGQDAGVGLTARPVAEESEPSGAVIVALILVQPGRPSGPHRAAPRG
jgi:superfamily II DNA or RNA helicase